MPHDVSRGILVGLASSLSSRRSGPTGWKPIARQSHSMPQRRLQRLGQAISGQDHATASERAAVGSVES